MGDLGVYIHVPFCLRKCSYCDFNAYSGAEALTDGYVDCIVEEIGRSPERGRRVPTVFFGGGTPTFLPAEQLARILDAVRATFTVRADAEVSSEANPTTADAARFERMRSAGFNRLSVGVQALDTRLLRRLDRDHTAGEARAAVRAAREAGFANVSIDLMFGLPGQTLAHWDATLTGAISLGTQHMSVYALTLEPGTRFERLHAGGKLRLPGEDDELRMYEHAIEALTGAGYEHYEVSNFARPGCRARHNLVYWHNEEYAGFGPGAVSYVAGRRWTNEKHPLQYIRKVRAFEDLAVESERLPVREAMGETLMVGLRLREGVSLAALRSRFGMDPAAEFAGAFSRLADRGFLEIDGDRARLTHEGLLFSNDAFVALLP